MKITRLRKYSILIGLLLMPKALGAESVQGSGLLVGGEISSAIFETPAEAPSVELLVAEALERNPSVSALRERLEAAHDMIAPEGALPDPRVEIMMQGVDFPRITLGDAEMSMIGVQVSQEIPYAGKRRARESAARAELSVRAAELEELKGNLVTQVRFLYARLYAIDQERKAQEIGRELLDMLSATVATRYSAGKAEQEAVIKAQLQFSRLKEKIIDLTSERRTVIAALNRLLDRRGDSPLGAVLSVPDPVFSGESWETLAMENASAIRVKRAVLEAADRRLEVAKSNLNPDFSVGAGLFSRGDFDHVATLQLGVEIPLWTRRKQRPLVRAAEHGLEMARQDLLDAQASVRSEAARLAAEWERSNRQIRLYEEAIIPQTSAALDAARASYLAGRGDYSTVIEDFNLWLEARVQLDRRKADRYVAWAQLDFLVNPIAPSKQGGPKP